MKYTTARGLSTLQYAMSIAATWVWAPAVFVASGIACQFGIEGLLWFLIPNTLTLVLFGYVFAKARANGHAGYLASAPFKDSPEQAKLHDLITLLLLSCSTFVQLLGIYTLFSALGCPRWLSGGGALAFALFLVHKDGLRFCIRTDGLKYTLMLGTGLALLCVSPPTSIGVTEVNSLSLALTFGIPTTIGLLAAPYVDTTFWQRAESLDYGSEVKTFGLSALLFCLIPLSFGLIGLGKEGIWTIETAFDSLLTRGLFICAVLSALLSTIDSNICAVGAYVRKQKAVYVWATLVFLAFLLFDKLTIVDMFLFYGTMRTVACVPTLLTVFGVADKTRLLKATIATAVVCPLGFAMCKLLGVSEWAVVFTILAVLLPLLGFSRRKETFLGNRLSFS